MTVTPMTLAQATADFRGRTAEGQNLVLQSQG